MLLQGFFALATGCFLLNHLKIGDSAVDAFASNCQFRGWFKT